MSIAAIIPEVWSALVKEELERGVVWGNVVEDLSNEIVFGDTVHLSQINTNFDQAGAIDSVTNPGVVDYTRNTKIAYAGTDAEDITLKLSSQKLWRFRVDDLDKLQTRPDLMQRNVGRAMRALARVVNDDIRKAFVGAGNTQITGASDAYAAVSVPDQSVARKADKSTYIATDTTYWNFGKDVLAYLIDAKAYADENYWPSENRYVIMPPQCHNKLIEYLIDQKPNLGGGMIIDEAFVHGQMPGMAIGFAGYIDPGITKFIPSGTDVSLTDALVSDMYFGIKNDGLGFAATVQQVEALRLHDYVADAVRGLYVYGTGRIMNDRMYRTAFTVQD